MNDRPSYRLSSGQSEALVAGMVRQIADRLSSRRPDELLTATARLAVIQATTLSPVLARALRARMPEVTGAVTRGEYAAGLRNPQGGGRQ